MIPKTGTNENFGLNQYAVATTASGEWASQITGQTGVNDFVLIGCDELVDPAGTASFLINQAHVSAIFGPIYDNDFEQVIPVANNSGTFLIGARNDDVKFPQFSGVGKNIWSCMPNRSIQVSLVPPLIADIEASIKVSHPADIKVFFAVANDAATTNFGTAVEAVLSFNGKSATSNGTNYVRQSVPPSAAFSFTAVNDYTSTVAAMITFQPDLVIVAQEFDVEHLLSTMNNAWPSTSPPLPRVLFFNEDPQVEVDLTAPGTNRFAGKVDFLRWQKSAQEQANAVSFAASYRSSAQQDPAFESERLYDCFYETAYSLQTNIDQGNAVNSISPTSFGAGITALDGPGTTENVGSSSILPTLTALSAKGAVDLEGASGPLNMSATQGSPIQDVALGCIHGDGGVALSGVTFDGADGGATGSYSCL